MASAASDGRPSPASTTTGTSDCSDDDPDHLLHQEPLFEPMGAARGMTHAAPASAGLFGKHRIGLAVWHDREAVPDKLLLVALSVSTGSGSRYLWSGCTSSFISLVPRHSRAICAAYTASLAFRAPAVFGRRVTPSSLSGVSISSFSPCR